MKHPRPVLDTEPMLLIFAHPDDETFGCAGTIAATAEAGVPVILICATRGEAGDSSVPGLDEPEVLGAVREEELRAAMAAVGVHDVRLLDYRDSGMPGAAANADPRALANAPFDLLVARLVVHIRALRPATIITFGPDGIYGHPDHLTIHRSTLAAIERAGDPSFRPALGSAWQTSSLYFNAVPRDELLAMLDRRGKPTNGMPAEQRDRMGTPREEIDTWIDISRWAEPKRRAILAHHTQTGEGGPGADLAAAEAKRLLSRETFVRVRLPWSSRGPDPLATLASSLPFVG